MAIEYWTNDVSDEESFCEVLEFCSSIMRNGLQPRTGFLRVIVETFRREVDHPTVKLSTETVNKLCCVVRDVLVASAADMDAATLKEVRELLGPLSARISARIRRMLCKRSVPIPQKGARPSSAAINQRRACEAAIVACCCALQALVVMSQSPKLGRQCVSTFSVIIPVLLGHASAQAILVHVYAPQNKLFSQTL